MKSERISAYDINLFQFIYSIASDVETYVEKFHTYLPDNSEEVLKSNLNDDLIGFLFEERNDLLKQKLISSINQIWTEVREYLKETRKLICEHENNDFISSESFYKEECEKINNVIHIKGNESIGLNEMNSLLSSFSLNPWINDQIDHINSLPDNIGDQKILKMDNILMVYDEFSYLVLQSIKVCKSIAENSRHPYEAFSQFRYSLKVVLYMIEFIDSIEIQ